MSALPKTTRRVGVRHFKGRALAIKPQRDYSLSDAEREANDLCILEDAEQMARWLCGDDLTYSHEQIKGWRIAALIRVMARILRRVVESKSTGRVHELERENAALRSEMDGLRGELKRLWVAESRCKAGQQELEFGEVVVK